MKSKVMSASKREIFKAGEVCEMAQLQPYVLRSWEAEFPQLGQLAVNGVARIYRRVDVELVLRIKQLVFGEGLTLAGARRRLEEERAANEPDTSEAELAMLGALDEMARTRLKQIRAGLEEILAMVSCERRGSATELQLVSAAGSRKRRSATTAKGRSGSRETKASTKGRHASA
jgi:DNA-binding transcriptional MerR regulator